VRSGSTVYVAGAGSVRLAAAYSPLLLGAAVVLVGDLIPGRGRRRGQAGLAGLNPPRFRELEICDTYGA